MPVLQPGRSFWSATVAAFTCPSLSPDTADRFAGSRPAQPVIHESDNRAELLACCLIRGNAPRILHTHLISAGSRPRHVGYLTSGMADGRCRLRAIDKECGAPDLR